MFPFTKDNFKFARPKKFSDNDILFKTGFTLFQISGNLKTSEMKFIRFRAGYSESDDILL